MSGIELVTHNMHKWSFCDKYKSFMKARATLKDCHENKQNITRTFIKNYQIKKAIKKGHSYKPETVGCYKSLEISYQISIVE